MERLSAANDLALSFKTYKNYNYMTLCLQYFNNKYFLFISLLSLKNYENKDYKIVYSDAQVKSLAWSGYDKHEGCIRVLTIREFTTGVCCDKHREYMNSGKGPGSMIIFHNF